MNYTITDIEAFDERGEVALALGGVTMRRRGGVAAKVTFADGSVWRVSKLTTDADWIIDGEWAAGRSFPIYWNGRGSRCTRLVRVIGDLVGSLDDATAEALR